MYLLLRFFLLLIPTLTFGQHNNEKSKASFNIYDFSDSRFDIDSNGFNGINKADTNYYSDKKIASIGHYAVAKNSRTSGIKFGLWTKYYHNGQIESQGNYDMYSLLYYESPKKGRRIESSYKVGKWVYYYENGKIKATGTYQTIIAKANTGIDNQFHKSSVTTVDWKFFNPNGSKSNDKGRIIADIEYNPNCD
jgi:antitoxin component YwqK of YwqJK toxin-antitoxin module